MDARTIRLSGVDAMKTEENKARKELLARHLSALDGVVRYGRIKNFCQLSADLSAVVLQSRAICRRFPGYLADVTVRPKDGLALDTKNWRSGSQSRKHLAN